MELDENEVMVISTASVDLSQAMVVVGMLSPQDFSHPLTQYTFAALQVLITRRIPLDELSLVQTLRTVYPAAGEDFLESVREILKSGNHTDDITYYARQIKNKSLARRLAKAGRDVVALADAEKDSVDAIAKAQDIILGLSRLYTDEDDLSSTGTAIDEIISDMQARSQNTSPITGIETGFTDLDERYMGGLQPGDLVILAARPSMGKTAFMLNLAENVCILQNRPTYLFSLEMSKKQLLLRLLASLAGVPANLIKAGLIPKEKMPQLEDARKRIAAAPLFINDTSTMNAATMQMLVQKAQLEFGDMSLICIDYLQLMEGRIKTNSRNEEISNISRALKQLARTSNAPVLALSQLSRAVESRDNKIPQLSDLRDSGSIEQDADVVLFLYRDEYYKKEKSEEPGIGRLIIGKQRNGPVGDMRLIWNPHLTRYYNMPKPQAPVW